MAREPTAYQVPWVPEGLQVFLVFEEPMAIADLRVRTATLGCQVLQVPLVFLVPLVSEELPVIPVYQEPPVVNTPNLNFAAFVHLS